MTNFVYAIGVVLIVQLITTYWFPITFILQLQILRIGVFLLLFGYIYFAGYLAKRPAGTQSGRHPWRAGDGQFCRVSFTPASPLFPYAYPLVG